MADHEFGSQCLSTLDPAYCAFPQHDNNSVAVGGVFDHHLAGEDRSQMAKVCLLRSWPVPSSCRRQHLSLPTKAPRSRVRRPIKEIWCVYYARLGCASSTDLC